MKLASALGVTSAWLIDGPDEAPDYMAAKKAAAPDAEAKARDTLRAAQIERAVQLLEQMDDADLSRALAMLQEFEHGTAESAAQPVKRSTGGRRIAAERRRTGSGE